MYCKYCGHEIENNASFCPFCGKKLSNENNMSNDLKNIVYPKDNGNVSSKSRLVTLLLCFFLGGIGIHAFYVGKIGAGVLMLLFCWTGIPALIALINFIMILCGTYTESEGKNIVMW